MREFRPTFAQYRGRLLSGLAGLVVVGVVDAFFRHWSIGAFFVGFGLVLVVIGIAIALYFRVTLVTSGPQRLTIRNMLGLSHTVDDRNLATVVRADDYRIQGRSGTAAVGRLFVLDGEGRAVLRWSTTTWTTAQMDDLTTSLSIPVESIPETVSTKHFRERYPKAVSSFEAHPVAWALGLSGAIVAVVAIVVVTIVS